MSDFDNAPYSGNGAGSDAGHGPEVRSMPFFPAPPGSSAPTPQRVPLGAPTSAVLHTTATVPGGRHHPGSAVPEQQPSPEDDAIPGRIKIEDAVVEKIVALAASEVAGVAGLATGGIQIRTGETDLTLDLTLVVEYGSVMMEVARRTRDNVGRVAGRMLGLRIAAVNVTVGDVWMPGVPTE
jgi:uncharacterized alkaline shock family protein YloU